MALTRDQVLAFLKGARPDLTEDDWREKADVVTVLSWALPMYARQLAQEQAAQEQGEG